VFDTQAPQDYSAVVPRDHETAWTDPSGRIDDDDVPVDELRRPAEAIDDKFRRVKVSDSSSRRKLDSVQKTGFYQSIRWNYVSSPRFTCYVI